MTVNKNPKVSIIIPVYNGKKYLKEAIDSALAQTYKNIEIIVVNDGSTDNGSTDKIALYYGNKIKYYKKENGGVSTALNLALKNMNGEYFSWLSHDDVYSPDKIEKQIAYLFKNDLLGKKVILYSDYDLIDKNSNLIKRVKKDHNTLMKKPEYAVLKGNINGVTLLIPKKAFDEHGFFDEKLKCVQDYEMWRLMLNSYKFIHIPRFLAKSREHGAQVTYNNPDVISEGDDVWKRIVDTPTNKVMVNLEGSKGSYYLMMAEFLYQSPYKVAFEYCKTKYLLSFKNKDYAKAELDYRLKNINPGGLNKKGLAKKILLSFKRYGLLITIKKLLINLKKFKVKL